LTLPRIPADPSWDPFLAEDEFLVWHGRPNGEQLVSHKSTQTSAMSIGFFIFAGVMLKVTWPREYDPSMWPIWGIAGAMILLGLWMLVGSHFRGRRNRQGTWYTLTNKRAFIATDLKKKRLSSYPIDEDAPLELVRGQGDGGDYVYFAQRRIKAKRRDESDRIEMIGFELIKDADSVFALFQRVQRGET
jgi:hypothetical protein